MNKLVALLGVCASFHLVHSAVLTENVPWSKVHLIRRQVSPSNGRIIGGDEVEPHSIPFQVGLRINGNAFCGGSLLSQNFVLTAGHCGEVIRSVDVILGAHNISNSNEETQTVISGNKVIIHADYDTVTLWNDITLIQLSESAALNDYIQLAKLPAKADTGDLYVNEIAVASGWGLIKDVPFPSTRDLSDLLQSVEVAVMNVTECGWYYNDEDGDYVVDTNVCTTGYRNKGTCNGDSGGPLTLEGVLIGLTSFGTELCETCAPSVYTRTASYLDWIAVNSDVVIN